MQKKAAVCILGILVNGLGVASLLRPSEAAAAPAAAGCSLLEAVYAGGYADGRCGCAGCGHVVGCEESGEYLIISYYCD